MIEFYKDNLVPPELCRILCEVVPKKHHVPVRFYNQRQKHLYGELGPYPLGSVKIPRRKKPSAIDINLNPIYEAGCTCSRTRESYAAYSPTSALWRLLLEVCLHEFGHVATKEVAHKMNQHEYHRRYSRVYKATEELAEEWKDRRIERILRVDPRLGQPKYISGYLGARLIRWGSQAKDIPGYYPFIIERRCQMTGGQVTAGDMLRKLNVNPYDYTNAYAVLKRASEGIGIDYVDKVGRHHKLYTWGDVPLVAQRFDQDCLREATSW